MNAEEAQRFKILEIHNVRLKRLLADDLQDLEVLVTMARHRVHIYDLSLLHSRNVYALGWRWRICQ